MSDLPSVLVTGGAGFIGCHVAQNLLETGRFKVVVLDDLSGGKVGNVPDEIEFVQGSIVDNNLLDKLFSQHKFKYVYHLAAYAAEGLSHFIRRFNYVNNVVGSINLINESVKHDVEKFVFTSSIATYGEIESPMREADQQKPEDPYGIAKMAVEMDLYAAKRMFDLDYVIFRPHNVYGEFQNIGDPYRNVIGIFMNQILLGKPLTIFGDGEQTRAFSYVGDLAGDIARSAWLDEASCEAFNVGADTPYTVNQLADVVRKALNVPNHPIEYLPQRIEAVEAYSDHSKFESVFKSKCLTTLEEGIEAMAKWVLKTGIQKSDPFEGVEVEKNMPPSWLRLMK